MLKSAAIQKSNQLQIETIVLIVLSSVLSKCSYV